MIGSGRTILGGALAVVAMLALGAASRAPWETGERGALLRLSWRARPETVEECRPLTPEELEELPVHMRRPEVCEGRTVPHLLRVEVDREIVVHDTIGGAGARADRPIHVNREISLPPGTHAVEVEFRPLSEESGPGEPRHEPFTPPLALRGSVDLALREVALVSYDPDRRELVLTDRP